MNTNICLTFLFSLALLQDTVWLVASQTQGPITSKPVDTMVWEQRINASLWLLHNGQCKFFVSTKNCTDLQQRSRKDMNVYIASLGGEKGKLVAVLPDKNKLVPNSYEAAVIIDPYPQVSFGHPVLVFLVEISSKLNSCVSNPRSTYTAAGECVTIAQKHRRCTNRLNDRKRKKRCDINFIPDVFHVKDDKEKSSVLKCVSGLAGFATCPTLSRQRSINDKCKNSKRCSVAPRQIKKNCHEVCDYAVLLSGGWNVLTTTKKSEENTKSIWRYLRKNSFKHKNIVTFVGSPYHIEIDGHPNTKDTTPAENEIKIRNQIKNFCSSPCVDSLFIYLNKPTKSNGAILLWDKNNDGFAEKSERYDAREFIDDLKNCKAKQVIVVVDQSFSGVLLEKFRSQNRHPTKSPLANVLMVTSSDTNGSPTFGSFTKNWENLSFTNGNKARCLKDIIKDVAMKGQQDGYNVNYEIGTNEILNHKIYGGTCDHHGNDKKGCHFMSRSERRKLNRG